MEENPRPYFSYLLRLWRAEAEGRDVWRASLEDPQTGQVLGFDHPESMFSFLTREMEAYIDQKILENPQLRKS